MDLVAAPLQVVLDNLVKFGFREGEFICNVDENLKKLERTCLKIQAFVQEAKEKRVSEEAWRVWLRDLEDAAYDAEDIVDEFAIELSRPEQRNRNDTNQVRNLVFSSGKLTAPRKIDKILNKMNELMKEMDSFTRSTEPAQMTNNMLDTSSQLLDEYPVIGRNHDASEIIKMLIEVEDSREDNVSVVPIVGMAGVGKTTLAKLVYDDQRIVGHFDLRIWEPVSSNLDVNRIVKSIRAKCTKKRKSIHAETTTYEATKNIHVNLENDLSSKKILLLLDDVWDADQQDWGRLLEVLRTSASKGSMIIMTTRSHATSAMANKSNTYDLKPLSKDDCWALIERKALQNITADNASNLLISIGREIAEKCQGLPWAAKMLGSIMQARVNVNEWTAISKSNMWDLPEVPRNDFLRSHRLPAYLKRCFSYCAIFPQNYEFSKDKLVQMWMAEGFIIPEGMRQIEDIGEKYFDNLLSMSIFQRDCSKFKMHNLIHALAQSISGSKCFIMMQANGDMQTSRLIGHVRHLVVFLEDFNIATLEAFYRCEGIRTFVLLREYGMRIKEFPFHLFLKWCRLRVLGLSGSHISILTDTLGNLIHLRYLDLSKTHIKWLPETIGKLYELQTLALKNCLGFHQLPECTKNLINLRHLELEGSRLTSMPSGIGKLIHLQTLKEFIVGTKGGRISEIKDINNLRGSICIKKLENVRKEDTSEALLSNKKFLHKLELHWSEMQDDGIHMQVLESLKPYESLKELTIRRYSGRSFPSWLGSSLYSNLMNLRLSDFRNCDVLPPLGCLPMLKYLEIAEMCMVEDIDSLFHGDGISFPSLETLKLLEMCEFKRWSRLQANDMPLLHKLIIDFCPKLTDLPALQHLASLDELEFARCFELSMLPEGGLPNALNSLIITECHPLLIERCGQGWEYWHMIERIPNKEINYNVF